MAPRTILTGWGRTTRSAADLVPVDGDDDLRRLVTGAGPRGVLARGLGRSYGDAAQNAGGTVLDMTAAAGVLSVDADKGLVSVRAGTSLDELMRLLLPRGLFVPVSPGTRQVTVGGAIAADVHGKNHHVDGSFGRHVESLDLLVADGSVRHLTPEDALFRATVGGMGLTGVVLRATVRMKRVESAYCVVETERTPDLDAVLQRMSEEGDRYAYSVAWVDCLARGRHLGRSVLTRGWPARVDQLPQRLRTRPLELRTRRRLAAPPVVPSGLLNRATVGAFNEAWYRRAPEQRRTDVQDFAAFFHPLDGVSGWNRLYGRGGLVQFQMVLPHGAEDALRHCVELVSDAGGASFLTVLKRFGAQGPGHLSFPRPGWTLALDLPATLTGLNRLLGRLDAAVLAAGGREYLAKDAHLSRSAVEAMYPRLAEWREVRRTVDPEGVFTSDLARRLGL